MTMQMGDADTSLEVAEVVGTAWQPGIGFLKLYHIAILQSFLRCVESIDEYGRHTTEGVGRRK